MYKFRGQSGKRGDGEADGRGHKEEMECERK